jgi:hypothetical protein
MRVCVCLSLALHGPKVRRAIVCAGLPEPYTIYHMMYGVYVYIRYFWQEDHQINGHMRCNYMILSSPMCLCVLVVLYPCDPLCLVRLAEFVSCS